MKILVDVVHPGHVHFFRHAIRRWEERGDKVLVTARRKDVTVQLLSEFGIRGRVLSRARSGLSGLLVEKVMRDSAMAWLARKWGAEVMLSISGPSVAHVGKLIGVPTVVFSDTEINRLNNMTVMPFATRIFTPLWFRGDFGKKHVRYRGSHELAYVHPDRFTPDPEVVRRAGLDPEERFFVVRAVAWKASHDVGHRGFTADQLRTLIRRLEAHGRVLLSSEAAVPEDLRRYAYAAPPSEIHHILAYAALCVGEGATLCEEAALMGTPTVLINHLAAQCGICLRMAQGGFLELHHGADAAWPAIMELAADPSRAAVFRKNAQRFVKQCEDVVDVVVSSVDPFR